MEIDPLLKMIAGISTKMDDSTQGRVQIEITLHVSGLLVTGRIISARQFLLEHPITDKILEAKDTLDKEDVLPVDPHDDGPQFIHLSDAHFFIPGHIPIPSTDKGVFWRCRLSDVSGFHFGILKASINP